MRSFLPSIGLVRLPRLLACLAALAVSGLSSAQVIAEGDQQAAEAFFETRIRPVLVSVCRECHAGDEPAGKLALDSREGLLAGGMSGPAIVPGKPAESLLLRAVRREGELKMPPDEPLSPESVAEFERWISAGATWHAADPAGGAPNDLALSHWAFQPVRSIEPPLASDWSDHPIDRFIARGHAEHCVTAVEDASLRTLVRRATFDLIGLPPTPEEIDGFLADDQPNAFARLIDRLLASPRYGERWGRHWMDVVRYADTAGDNADYPVPEARLYRDYIIDSFNADKPYDEFVCEQLAGDILARGGPPERYAERMAATGFLALSRRYGTAPGELWHLTLEDTIDTTGQALLGLTVRCARCHDHKFDPVTTEDYYALYGLFASTRFPYAGSEELSSKQRPRADFVPLSAGEETAAAIAAFQAELAAAESQVAMLETSGPLALELAKLRAERAALDAPAVPENTDGSTGAPQTTDASRTATADARAGLDLQIQEVEKKHRAELDERRKMLVRLRRPGLPAGVPCAYAVSEGAAVDVPVQRRGDPAQAGPIVPRGGIRFLRGDRLAISAGASGRLEFARWLTTAEHPLTARVIVNRIWQHHFGAGLVATPSNFGVRGAAPTHPELLDWLAREFVARGWSIKHLHRQIMTSRTYQLASSDAPTSTAIDPSNQYLWRHNRRRLDAESLRDAMLAVAGHLDLARPGPHPFPHFDQWNWTQHRPFKQVYESNHRSVYLMTQRLQRHPYLALFDGADTNHTTDLRTSATVPLQALYLRNHAFVIEQADGLAKQLLAQHDARIERGYKLAWGREPTLEEVSRAETYLSSFEAELAKANFAAENRQQQAWASLAKILLTANEFLYVD